MEDFIYRYRFLIGGILIFIIVGGLAVIWWDKGRRAKVNNENQTIVELQKQNDLLRQELSKEVSPAVAGESDNQGDKIDINTASADELDKLPNIGPARAADIIASREERGGFSTIEELKNISGIGDKTFEELKDLVTVGE